MLPDIDGMYGKMVAHPKLARAQVWCTVCGHTMRTDSKANLQKGWPKCCGYPMTTDSPEERAAR